MGNVGSVDIWSVASTGQVPKATFYRTRPKDVHATDKDGHTPLHWAARGGHEEAVRYLLERGADPAARTRCHETPLYMAINAGAHRVALKLLEADRAIPGHEFGKSPLHLAASLGQAEVVRALLARGVLVDLLDFRNQTALHLAVRHDPAHMEVIRILVDAGAQLGAQDDCKRTPLHLALARKKLAVAKFLVEAGTPLGLRFVPNGMSAFHMVTLIGDIDTALLLMKHGASLVAVDNQGRSPLHLAALSGFTDFVRMLMTKGAPVNSRDNRGQTPLHCLAYGGMTECAQKLIDGGADLEITDNMGRTPLHYAAAKIYGEDVVRLLLLRGARVDARDQDGCQPLHLAALNGNTATAERLVGAGASLEAENAEGLTPFRMAQSREWDNTMEVLCPEQLLA